MTENPLTYIFSLQDNVSDKLRPIMDLTETILNTFSRLEVSTITIQSIFEETGTSITELQDTIGAPQEGNELISEEKVQRANSYAQELAEADKRVSAFSATTGKAFSQVTAAVNTLTDSIDKLKGKGKWISDACIDSVKGCTEAIEGLVKQTSQINSFSTKRIEETSVSMGALKSSVVALRDEGEWIAADKMQLFVQCRKRIEEVREGVTKLKEASKSPLDELTGSIVNSIPILKTFSSISSVVGAAVSGINGIINKGEAAWGNYKEKLAGFQSEMRKSIGATDDEVASILSLINAQQKLGVVGKQVQMAGVEELSTHVTRHQSIQELLPTLNNVVAQQHGVNATQEQAAEIAGAFGEELNGQTDALSQYGYSFTEAQKQLLQYGEEADKIRLLTETVGDAVNGVNQALAETPEGEWQQHEEKMNGVYETVGKLKEQFTETLFPVFKSAGELLAKVVDGIDEKMGSISEVLGTIATGVAEVFELLSPVIEGIVELIGMFFDELANGNPLVVGMTTALGAYLAITELTTVGTTLYKIATQGLNAVQTICNGLFSASPLGKVAMAIGAVTAAVVYCWQNFEGFRKVVSGVWEVIKELGRSLVESIIAPIKQIMSGISSIFSAIGSAFKGNFAEAGKQAKEGFKDLAKGMVSGSPIGIAVNTYKNADITGAYDKGVEKITANGKASHADELTEVVTEGEGETEGGGESGNTEGGTTDNETDTGGKNGKKKKSTTVTTVILATSPDATVPSSAVTPAGPTLPDKSMLPDLNPTADYNAIVSQLTPQKVDLAPAKTATEAGTIEINNKGVVDTASAGDATTGENEFEANDAEQLYQLEEKGDVLQAILENVQKLVDLFKGIGTIKNNVTTSYQLGGISLELNAAQPENLAVYEKGQQDVLVDTASIDDKLDALISLNALTGINSINAVALLGGLQSQGNATPSIEVSQGPEGIAKAPQSAEVPSLSSPSENVNNTLIQQIEGAKNSLSEVYEAFTSFVGNDLGTGISSAIETLKDKLLDSLNENLQPGVLVDKTKEAINQVNNFMDIDLSTIGTEIADALLAKLEELFDTITGSKLAVDIMNGFEAAKEKITTGISDNLQIEAITEGVKNVITQVNNWMETDLASVGTEIVNTFVNEIGTVFDQVMESDLVTTISNSFDSVKDTIINAIPDKLQLDDVMERLKSAANQIDTVLDIDLGEIGTEIADFFADKLNDVVESLMNSDLATTIAKTFDSIKENIINAIPDKLQLEGLEDKFKSAVSQLDSILSIDFSDVGRKVADFFTDRLGDAADSFINSDWVTNITEGSEKLKEGFNENITNIQPENLREKVKEAVTPIREVLPEGPSEAINQFIDSSFDKVGEFIGLPPISSADPTSGTSILPEERGDSEQLPETAEDKKSKKKGLLKRALGQIGAKAISTLTHGMVDSTTVMDKVEEITGKDKLPGLATTEDELNAAVPDAVVSAEESMATMGLSALSENEGIAEPAFSLAENSSLSFPLPTPAEEGLTDMPSFRMTDNRLLTPEALSSDPLFDTETTPDGEPEEIGGVGSMFHNLFDDVRQMAAITAIPLAMAAVSPGSDLQSVSLLEDNTNNTSSIFDQSDDSDEKGGRSISIDQICEQIVIHVENTDREGTEHIKEEIYRVLREIVES